MKLEKVIAVRTSKTIYRDGQYVIKVFDEGYSKADILNEALNIARVEETGLPIHALSQSPRSKASGLLSPITLRARPWLS